MLHQHHEWIIQFAILGFSVSVSIFVLFVVFILLSNIRTNSKINYAKNTLFSMGHQAFSLDCSPLKGKVAIVTGSTNGIGEQTAKELYHMGAHVVVASRTLSKCQDTVSRIQKAYPRSVGKIEAMQLDTSDFDNVRAFAKKFNKNFSKLNFLINNAGIHYLSWPGAPVFNPTVKTISKQGFDLAFATNYMGHWLLVDLLLPIMTATGAAEPNHPPARVVNIASAYHLGVNGSMLQPVSYTKGSSSSSVMSSMPQAGRADIFTSLHRRRSYANNKLAQVLHTHELTRRLQEQQNHHVQVVSVCPGWVSGTGIVADSFADKIIQTCGFELESATMAHIGACVNPHLTGGEHCTNYIPFWTHTISFPLLDKLGIRDIATDLLGGLLLLVQLSSFGFNISSTSPESYNIELARDLYDWTEEAVQESSL